MGAKIYSERIVFFCAKMKLSTALLATIATTNVAADGECPESHPLAGIRIGKCCKDLVCRFPDYISCPSNPDPCVDHQVTDDEEEVPTQTDLDGYKPCPDTHPWEYESDYPMCCDVKPIVNKWGGEDCNSFPEYREYDYSDDNDEDEEPTRTDLPGYKPCPDTHPWEYDNSYDEPMCCPEKPVLDEIGVVDCYSSMYREYDYGDDDDEEPAEQTCPENMPFNFLDGYMCCEEQEDAEDNCPEGAQSSDCSTHHPDTGIYTCADHPTAVRKEDNEESTFTCKKTPGQGCNGLLNWGEIFMRKISDQSAESCLDNCRNDEECKDFVVTISGSCYLFSGQCDDKSNQSSADYYECSRGPPKCPACWKENDANECEFDTSATECFTQTCNNGAMQLSINFENLFNSKAADIGDYDATIGVDLENWPSQTIEFTDNAILMKLKVTTDDLNDPDVTCGTKTNLGGHEVVVATGAGPCLEVNFVCSFPREVELSSDGFVVESSMTVGKTTDENEPPAVAGNIKNSFKPMDMVNEDGDAVTDDNVKLGSKISASLESTLASDRLGLYVKDCSIKEGDQAVSIINNGCYSSAVGASYVNDYISPDLKASIQWNTFIIGTFQKTTSTQVLTCTARLCDQTSCKSEVAALICPVDDSLSYVHAKDIE